MTLPVGRAPLAVRARPAIKINFFDLLSCPDETFDTGPIKVCQVAKCEAGMAQEMLAVGVIIADFEARFERQGGLASDDFHKEWEAIIALWWELASRYEGLSDHRGDFESPAAYKTSIARMSKWPQGSGSDY